MSRSSSRFQRGGIYIEALVIIPVFATLWELLLFIERGNTVDDENVRRSRYCAWRFASDECEGPPLGCEVDGPSVMDGSDIDGVSSASLTRLVRVFPFAAEELGTPHGEVFRATARDRLGRPFDWGAIDVESHQSRTCQVRKGRWRPHTVLATTCAWHGLAYCAATYVPSDLPGIDLETTVIPIDGSAAWRLDAWRAAQP